MVVNAVFVSALYIIDRIIPETNWRESVIPRRNPKFHMKEIEAGVGRSAREAFTVFRIGFFFVSWVFIKILLMWIAGD